VRRPRVFLRRACRDPMRPSPWFAIPHCPAGGSGAYRPATGLRTAALPPEIRPCPLGKTVRVDSEHRNRGMPHDLGSDAAEQRILQALGAVVPMTMRSAPSSPTDLMISSAAHRTPPAFRHSCGPPGCRGKTGRAISGHAPRPLSAPVPGVCGACKGPPSCAGPARRAECRSGCRTYSPSPAHTLESCTNVESDRREIVSF